MILRELISVLFDRRAWDPELYDPALSDTRHIFHGMTQSELEQAIRKIVREEIDAWWKEPDE